ncbi:MAG: hypothetical protein IJA67_01765 [Oscillospiraceae bacterium]|nr:hypothetical protein [Oscillospiraceae bacterium]
MKKLTRNCSKLLAKRALCGGLYERQFQNMADDKMKTFCELSHFLKKQGVKRALHGGLYEGYFFLHPTPCKTTRISVLSERS